MATYEYIDTTERIGSVIMQIVADTDGSYANPRGDDNLSVIYGDHRDYTIGDGKPPSDEWDALNRGGMRLLYRYLRLCKGMVAFAKLGMYEHSGVKFYAVPLDTTIAGWDNSAVGYAYVTQEQVDALGVPEGAAYTQMVAEIKEYSDWADGKVWGYVITRPCDHPGEHATVEALADCPHSPILDSSWGYVGEAGDLLDDARQAAKSYDDDETGICDTCGAEYPLAERSVTGDLSIRCGECGNCSLHCPPEHTRSTTSGEVSS